MRTITETIRLRKFDELTPEEQEKVISSNYDFNVNDDWWDMTYMDAENVGLKIEEFDLDRNRHCKISFMWSALQTAEQILKDHGEDCDTYKTAQEYMEERNRLIVEQCQYEADCLCSNKEDWEWEELMYYPEELYIEDIDNDFRRALQEDFASILQHEYDYLTSEEAIRESIEANEYEFTDNLKIY